MIGEPLLPWQEWVVIHALELQEDGDYRFRVILILVARQNGKSHLKRVVSLWRMYFTSKARILGTAQDVSLAREQLNVIKSTIHDCPDLQAEWAGERNVNGDEQVWAGLGGRYSIKAANRRAGRGGSYDEVNLDELREQTNWEAWSAISKTTLARPNSQLWAMSNQGDDESVVLHQLRSTAQAGSDPSLFLAEYSGVDGCELDSLDDLRQANPGLGYTLSWAGLMSALSTDPPGVFRTECLCQRVDQLDGAIDLAAWQGCADPTGTMTALRHKVAACFDISPDGEHATLAVAAVRGDGKVRVEIVKAWPSVAAARDGLGAAINLVGPVALAWYPTGPAAAFASILRPLAMATNKRPVRHPGMLPEDGELTGSKVAEVCMALSAMVRSREMVHPADPLLDAHIAGARKLAAGDGWRFTRRAQFGHVDAAYAVAGAVEAALALPEPAKPGLRVLTY